MPVGEVDPVSLAFGCILRSLALPFASVGQKHYYAKGNIFILVANRGSNSAGFLSTGLNRRPLPIISHPMRAYFILCCVTLLAVLTSPARAQCVALSDLLAIGADPTAQSSGKVVTDHVSTEWTFVGPTPMAKEAFWTFMPAGASAPTGRLQVRSQRPGQDVVLKSTQANCLRDLRSELKARKLTAQPVTCPNCEAVRYQAADFDVTLYSQMKGEFPFIAVVHQVPPGMPPAAAVGTAGNKTP